MNMIFPHENKENRWARHFTRGYGFNSVAQAIDFMKDIDDFKNDK